MDENSMLYKLTYRTYIGSMSFIKGIHYCSIEQKLKKRRKPRINFGIYAVYDSTYGADGIFRMMIDDTKHWNPHIVIIPDISRGKDHQIETYNRTKEFFISRYGKEYVLDGFDIKTNEFYDRLKEFDIIIFANPYDSMVAKMHSIKYASSQNVLPVILSYAYDVGRFTTINRLESHEYNWAWKCFADTVYSYEDCKRFMPNKGKNVILSGYSKMDNYCPQTIIKKKKRILISPHHTVDYDKLPLSNFLKFNDLIPELATMFPQIEFVFRPHPLLFTTLINKGLWTDEEVSSYLDVLGQHGIVYSQGGDYFDLFNSCDAIINDCGSYTVEWLFTGKPGCFVLCDKLNKSYVTKLMRKSISQYDIARSRQDIINFVKKIASESDEKKYTMQKWVRANIAVNYPNASEVIMKEIRPV